MSGRPGGGGSKSTTTKIDPAMMEMYQNTFQRAQEVADQPFQLYTDQRFAPLNADQNQAISQLRSNAGLLGSGLGEAYQAAQAGLNPNIRDVTAGSVAGTDLSQYMNPYTDQVIGGALSDLDRARQMAIGAGEDSALAVGAYGGSRHGVADSLTNEAFADQASNLASQLRLQGFDRATGLAGQDVDRAFNAASANQNADFSREQLRRAAAGGLINLGLGGAGMLFQAGGLQNAHDQQVRDFAYQQFLAQQGEGARDVGLLNSVLSGMPSGSTTTQTQSGGFGSMLSGGLGGAMTGAQLGSIVPGLGTGTGAVLGGLVGLL